MRVCVDTTAPKATLFRPEINQKTVELSWDASDANLADQPITLEWAEHKNGPCHVIGDNLPNTGSYKWHSHKEMPSRVYLRIRVRDKAGNEACAATEKPVSLVPKHSSKLDALFRDADGYFKLNEYEKAIQKYEEIAKMGDYKPAGLRALGGTIRCFGAMGDHERCKQQVQATRDRLDMTEELADEERQQWLKWLDMLDRTIGNPKTGAQRPEDVSR